MLVEALVSEPPVEALDEVVLHRLVGCDAMPFDATIDYLDIELKRLLLVAFR